MSWIQKLCEVYDVMSGEESCDLVPIGFTEKKIKYNVILSADGEFVTAQQFPKESQLCIVPTTSAAEGRTGSNGAPFPLAEQLKYLVCPEGQENPRLANYLKQLADWCKTPDAPECLSVLYHYLEKRTLYADMMSVPNLKLRYNKENQDGRGPDAGSMACFSIQSADSENRLWMRHDVRESWTRYFFSLSTDASGLCYASGQRLPILQNHPKLSGNAKLISAKDAGFPFQYKGRFTEDRSAAAVSHLASIKAHNALLWLLKHQGFQRFGMNLVAWHTYRPVLSLDTPFDDEVQETPSAPDTFESYALALRNAAFSCMKELGKFSEKDDKLTDETRQRMNEVVIIGLQAATDGRMSISYYQEMPGNLYVDNLNRWAEQCQWILPGKVSDSRSPRWRHICEAVMGGDAVRLALQDVQSKKSASKQMREMQMRLLNCIVNAEPVPSDFLWSSFHRSIQPLSFTDKTGQWNSFSWAQCIAVTCALLRQAHSHTCPTSAAPSWILDCENRNRDYLYGRLLAVSHKLEQDTIEDKRKRNQYPTNAVRLMTRFTQSPADTWLHLYCKLLPYLKKLGTQGYRSAQYLRLFGEIERNFSPDDRASSKPLSFNFLVGFSAQLRELYLPAEQQQSHPVYPPFAPPQGRDALYGCMLAVADFAEWRADATVEDEYTRSAKDGRTNAMLLTSAFIARPSAAWMNIHNKMIPYLEKSGVALTAFVQQLLVCMEQRFTLQERSSSAPLGSVFLNSYLCMRLALTSKNGPDLEAWTPCSAVQFSVRSREAAFGALLALENQVERMVLDSEKMPEENRPSNAMRYLERAAQRPWEVTEYLIQRLQPYQRKRRFIKVIPEQIQQLTQLICDNNWNTDTPLQPEYLHAFYTYNIFD